MHEGREYGGVRAKRSRVEERLAHGVCDHSCLIWKEGSICTQDDELYSFIFSVFAYFSS